MKKILMTMLIVTFLALAMAGSAAAGDSFTGSTFMSYGTFASIIVSTSSNVFLLYIGNSSDAQSYGAYTKNKAGDKYYATGGGQGSSSGIYYNQSDGYVGKTDFPSMSSDKFVQGSGWTAQ
jgi:hypothetical protein